MDTIQIHHLATDNGECFECPHCRGLIRATMDLDGETIFMEVIAKEENTNE